MHTDHHALSGAAHPEHSFGSRPLESAPRLRSLVDDVLREAIAAMRARGSRAPVAADRDPMRELCAAARANEVRAEEVILAIKDGWRRLPESHGTNRLDAEVALAAVITRCIREYYGPRPA